MEPSGGSTPSHIPAPKAVPLQNFQDGVQKRPHFPDFVPLSQVFWKVRINDYLQWISGAAKAAGNSFHHIVINVPMFPFCSVSPQAQIGQGLASVEWPSRSCRISLKIFFIGEEVYTFVIHWAILPETWRSVNSLDQALFESLALVLAL